MTAYTGTSIVDYLNQNNQASDFASRSNLAANNGIVGYSGTSAQNTQLLGLLNKPLAPATAPVNTANVNTTSQVNTPTGAVSTPGVNGVNGLVSFYQSHANQESQLKATQSQNQSSILSLLGNNTQQTARDNANAQTGVNPTEYFANEKARIAEIDTLNGQYNDALKARDEQIAQTNDKLASNDFINNQIAQINRNAAPQLNSLAGNINSKAAALQASQGMFAEAQNYVKQAVDAATADAKAKLDSYTFLYNSNQNAIDSLDTKYQNALRDATSAAKSVYEQQVTDKNAIGQLMISNPQAGISINDTIDQAYAKVGLNPKTSSEIIGSADTGYYNVVKDANGNIVSKSPIVGGTNTTGTTSPGFGSSKIESSVREDAVALLYSKGLKPADAFTQLRTAYSTKEVSDAALNALLGITPTATVAQIIPPAPIFNNPSNSLLNPAPFQGQTISNATPGNRNAFAFETDTGLTNTIYDFLFK